MEASVLRDYEQRIKDLEATNLALRDKLLEHDKLRKVYVEDLNAMKCSLGSLQTLLMKCRADILCHEMLTPSEDLSMLPVPVPNTLASGTTNLEVVSLHAQLEVCKSDLAEQRAAYQELLIEKNRITAELQVMLQRNHQLSMDNAHTFRERPKRGSIKLYGTSPGIFERLVEPCPHCNNVFGDFVTLETHIKDCPGLDY